MTTARDGQKGSNSPCVIWGLPSLRLLAIIDEIQRTNGCILNVGKESYLLNECA